MASSPNSAAYDLSLFEPKKAPILQMQPSKKQARAQKRQTRLQSLINTAVAVAVACVTLFVLCSMITGRVRLNEIKTDIADAQSTLSELKSEQVRLETELTGKLSGQSLDAYTEAQGLHVANSSQINYITRSEGDEVSVSEDDGAWWSWLIPGEINFFG